MTTRQIYIIVLSAIVLAVIVGKIILSWKDAGAQEGLIAIGAVAVGTLATLALIPDRNKPPIPPPSPGPPPVPPGATEAWERPTQSFE